MHRNRFWPWALATVAISLGLAVSTASAGERIRIEKLDDLPRHAFRVESTASELVSSPALFAPFAAEVRADLEGLLNEYDITDPSTRSGIHQTLLLLDLMDERWDSVPERVALLRSLEDKPGPRQLTGLSAESIVAAVAEAGGRDAPGFVEAYRAEYAARVAALPWAQVQEQLEGTKGQLEMMSPNLLEGVVSSQIDPVVAQRNEASRGLAMQLVSLYYALHHGMQTRDATIAVLAEAIDRNREEKPDIWAARSLDLTGREGLHPVPVCVWDTGVDTQIFGDQLITNAKEKPNGRDDDGNGFVDDLHGIAYDEHWNRVPGELYPMTEAIRPISELQASVKGLFDLQAAIDSDEARALRELMVSTPPEEMKGLIEDLGRYTLYSHGTHVAGIALEGNPAARLTYVRLTGDPSSVPEAATMEDSKNAARAFQEVVEHLRAQDVRVVNMSWVIARSSIESSLEANGVGSSTEERKKMARDMFEVMKTGLRQAFESAPEILFVGGAGNSDNDVSFDEFMPPMFELPNLIIAGAVDQSGEATGFTSFGPTVKIYSNGFEVESYVPGGDRIPFSGTSMASPNVANLAAKLIAIQPGLTPPQVIDLILAGADERTEGTRTFKVMNPKRSAELLDSRQGS